MNATIDSSILVVFESTGSSTMFGQMLKCSGLGRELGLLDIYIYDIIEKQIPEEVQDFCLFILCCTSMNAPKSNVS